MFIHITLAGSKVSSGTLPTMHSILYMYIYTDIYQGLNIFYKQLHVHIYIYFHFVIYCVTQVHIIRRGGLYGPLIPQEIKELVIAKYKEVSLGTVCNLYCMLGGLLWA